ncbi:MAG TPA: hypothetical protein PJ991_13080 [Kiritimatiellia bacterium]|nr:hypothetical protein [Kiritimatiellia bacterium]
MKEYIAVIYELVKQPDGTTVRKPITTATRLSVPMIAKMEEASKQSIYREIENGNLKPVSRLGARIRVSLDEYIRWRDANSVREYERGMGARTLAEMARRSKNN